MRLIVTLGFILGLGIAPASGQQPFVTIDGDLKQVAWWVIADFHPFTMEVRGIPVSKIRTSWCKATEFRRELIPKTLLVINGVDVMEASKLSFTREGSFDDSGKKQVALTGVYQECSGQKGSFILILDQPRGGLPKVRFVDAAPTEHQFGALSSGKDNSIVWWACMDCDVAAILKWDPQKRKFYWLQETEE